MRVIAAQVERRADHRRELVVAAAYAERLRALHDVEQRIVERADRRRDVGRRCVDGNRAHRPPRRDTRRLRAGQRAASSRVPRPATARASASHAIDSRALPTIAGAVAGVPRYTKPTIASSARSPSARLTRSSYAAAPVRQKPAEAERVRCDEHVLRGGAGRHDLLDGRHAAVLAQASRQRRRSAARGAASRAPSRWPLRERPARECAMRRRARCRAPRGRCLRR